MSEDRARPADAAAVSRRRRELRADCARCAALCCVATAFTASADFAITKPAGRPCQHLTAGFRCSIHDRLRPAGFPGCAAFDCFGAGQAVVQGTFGGRDWRADQELAAAMFAVFPVVRQLHELMFYLNEALALAPGDPFRAELDMLLARTSRLARCRPDELMSLDVADHRRRVNAALLAVSDEVRTRAVRLGAGQRAPGPPDQDQRAPGLPGQDLCAPGLAGQDLRAPGLAGQDLHTASLRGASLRGADLTGTDLAGKHLRGADLTGADLRGADLAGTDLRRADLAGASLRGALLIGAGLAGANLDHADLTGADMRGADLTGASLVAALFVSQPQLDSARGDAATTLPAHLTRPPHWPPPT